MMKKILPLLLFILLVSPPTLRMESAEAQIRQDTVGQDTGDLDTGDLNGANIDDTSMSETLSKPLSPESIQRNLEGPVDADDIAAASSWAGSSGIVEWLGPMAPLALSPFFGVTCLSGLAMWGPSWVTDNAVLGATGPLGNPWLFGIFLTLTLLTSLPRLTKVSKPFAQAVDRLETYAVIIILLVIKLVISMDNPEVSGAPVGVAMANSPVIHFGIVSMTLDTLLSIAMVINILVINSVKFFFEFLVWLTPVPFLDAVFEVCNKSLCAALMAVYAMSPTLATVINLCVLFVALLMLRWINRRVRFYRTMILDPILARLFKGFATPKRPELIVFPQDDFGPFAAKSRLTLTSTDKGLSLNESTWWKQGHQLIISPDPRPGVRRGWVMHSIALEFDGQPATLKFSRRYEDESLVELLQSLGLDQETSEQIAEGDHRIEFA